MARLPIYGVKAVYRIDQARRGGAWRGKAGLGLARRGAARQGLARQGSARLGGIYTTSSFEYKP